MGLVLWILARRRSALCIVKPETVIAWQRKGFRLFWTWKVHWGQRGRPPASAEIRKLIRRMSRENPLWGAPRIHGELPKLGIAIGETSVRNARCTSESAFADMADLPESERHRASDGRVDRTTTGRGVPV